MKNEFNKTVVGLLVVVGVVLLTYSYGNTQRTGQLKHQQTVASSTAPSSAPTNNVQVATPAPAPKVVAVVTPTVPPKPTVKPTATPSISERTTPSPSLSPAVAGATTEIPDTGSPFGPILALGAMSLMAALYFRSRRNA